MKSRGIEVNMWCKLKICKIQHQHLAVTVVFTTGTSVNPVDLFQGKLCLQIERHLSVHLPIAFHFNCKISWVLILPYLVSESVVISTFICQKLSSAFCVCQLLPSIHEPHEERLVVISMLQLEHRILWDYMPRTAYFQDSIIHTHKHRTRAPYSRSKTKVFCSLHIIHFFKKYIFNIYVCIHIF